MVKLRCVIMRGGTSKAVFFHENELPSDPRLRDRVVLDVFGSPDLREIDGLGGADGSTSKLSIVSRYNGSEADVEYSFGQVMFDEPLAGQAPAENLAGADVSSAGRAAERQASCRVR
jgi:2-methylaconitate cis-trans-isomerase PrpF